jgi:O-methyltransferase
VHQNQLRVTARSVLRHATRPLLPYLRDFRVERWPALMGSLHEISVPRGVAPYSSPTPACTANINILLELLDSVRAVPGAVAECGVFRGGTLIPMALHLRQAGPERAVYGFDSFAGFGESITSDLGFERTQIDPKMKASGFSDTSYELVSEKLRRFGVPGVKLVPGYFETSLATCPEQQFAFVHLDVDTYVGYRACLEHFYPRLASGAVVVFDEYNDPAWPGCDKAVDEFLRERPEKLAAITRDNFVKSYFVKQ